MGINDRDYMREHAREREKAERVNIKQRPKVRDRQWQRLAPIALFWVGVLLLLWAGFSFVR